MQIIVTSKCRNSNPKSNSNPNLPNKTESFSEVSTTTFSEESSKIFSEKHDVDHKSVSFQSSNYSEHKSFLSSSNFSDSSFDSETNKTSEQQQTEDRFELDRNSTCRSYVMRKFYNSLPNSSSSDHESFKNSHLSTKLSSNIEISALRIKIWAKRKFCKNR